VIYSSPFTRILLIILSSYFSLSSSITRTIPQSDSISRQKEATQSKLICIQQINKNLCILIISCKKLDKLNFPAKNISKNRNKEQQKQSIY